MKSVLITGINGQDGTILSHLLKKRFPSIAINGTSRTDVSNFSMSSAKVYKTNLENNDAVENLIKKLRPDTIFHFSGQSSVSKSFEKPEETYASHYHTTKNLLDAIEKYSNSTRLFFSSSSECFGSSKARFNENTPHNPQSPYAKAKSDTVNLIHNHRKNNGSRIIIGYFTNHESLLRPDLYVTKKIVNYAKEATNKNKLRLGNINIFRDWGWAEDYMNASIELVINQKFDDYVIGTGISHSLEHFVQETFSNFGINDYKNYIETDENLFRSSDIKYSYSDPRKIFKDIGWTASKSFSDIVTTLCKNS